eukprot:7293913-Prymnesium_polylepis.1
MYLVPEAPQGARSARPTPPPPGRIRRRRRRRRRRRKEVLYSSSSSGASNAIATPTRAIRGRHTTTN